MHHKFQQQWQQTNKTKCSRISTHVPTKQVTKLHELMNTINNDK